MCLINQHNWTKNAIKSEVKFSNLTRFFHHHAKLYLDRTSKTRRFEVSFFHGSRHIHNNKQVTHLQLQDMITFYLF